jgi:hypothetical protein
MQRNRTTFVAGLSLALGLALTAGADEAPKSGRLFNGLDLKGWKLKGDEKKSKWVVGRA